MTQDNEIIRLAFKLGEMARRLVEHARQFCYEVMLSGHACPRCGGRLIMLAESRCRCASCNHTFDPTVEFQRCPDCGGKLRIRICRYRCRSCGQDVPSRFVFDGVVFDREYFREKMAESRRRRTERREHLAHLVAANQSRTLTPPAAELDSIPGLVDALNSLASVPDLAPWLPLVKGFDLNRYQAHLEAHLCRCETDFDDLPALDEDARLDRIWRFITIIFMAHAGLIEIHQRGQTILILKHHEIDREGP